jgi:hypothetical protein
LYPETVEVLAVQDKLTECGVAATPLPLSATVAGEPAALLVIVTPPVTLPAVVGLKITLKVNFCDGDRVTGTLAPLNEKPVPLILICEIWTFELPVLVTVSVCVEETPVSTLPKFTLVVLNDSVSVAVIPVPLKDTPLGDPAALLTIEMPPLAEPVDDG